MVASHERPRPTDDRDVAPVDTPYGTREGAHVDPDNNVLRDGT